MTAHWFTHDLRLADQPLWAQHPPALAVYVFQPRWLEGQPWSHLGPHRATFLFQSLLALRQNLQQRGTDLHLLWGDPAAVLPGWLREHSIDQLTAVDAYTPWEQRQLEAMEAHVQVIRGGCHTLLHPADLPFESLPEVFTSFRKRVENPLKVREEVQVDAPWRPSCADEQAWKRLEEHTAGGAAPMCGGEAAGLERLQAFIFQRKALGTYKETRNGMLDPWHSSRLSPWLANGSLSARTVYAAVRSYENIHGANESTYWLIFELLWRDFFHWSARERRGRLFQLGGWSGTAPNAQFDPATLERWCKGLTGNDLVDACMRELQTTGWMSNRGRQNAASYLIHELGQPWLAGAQWFEHQLVDFDPASNYGNWQYLAGVGHDPLPHRWFNTVAQAERYDPTGDYRATWLK